MGAGRRGREGRAGAEGVRCWDVACRPATKGAEDTREDRGWGLGQREWGYGAEVGLHGAEHRSGAVLDLEAGLGAGALYFV